MSPKSDVDIEHMSRVSYSSAIGSLMYVMVCTRPDLSYALSFFFLNQHALSVVNRYMANPRKEHWKGTSNTCLQFAKSRDGLVNSNIAGDLEFWTREDHSKVMFSPLVVVL